MGKRFPCRGNRISKALNLKIHSLDCLILLCTYWIFLATKFTQDCRSASPFTQHYHLSSLYFNLNLFFLEGKRKVVVINGLDVKRGMINYNL